VKECAEDIIPAKAGIQREDYGFAYVSWIPAFAGMTSSVLVFDLDCRAT